MAKKNKRVTDEEITSIINDAIQQAVGSFTSGSELQEQRETSITIIHSKLREIYIHRECLK